MLRVDAQVSQKPCDTLPGMDRRKPARVGQQGFAMRDRNVRKKLCHRDHPPVEQGLPNCVLGALREGRHGKDALFEFELQAGVLERHFSAPFVKGDAEDALSEPSTTARHASFHEEDTFGQMRIFGQ